MLEDGDVMHLDAHGHAHVFNALALTSNTLAAKVGPTTAAVSQERSSQRRRPAQGACQLP